MSARNGIPTFVHLALTSASTEVRRVAQLTAELPDHDRRIKELREAYAQEKADAEKALSARAAEVDAAVKEREGIVGALGEAQENAQGGQDMVRLWCQANNRPVPDLPDLRDLTMPFQSVAPVSGPVQSVPDGSDPGAQPAADPNRRVDLSATRPDCPGCESYAGTPEGCPEHGNTYAGDGAQ